MSHGLEFGKVSGIFSFAHGGVIARDFLDATIPKLVEASVTDVPYCCRAILDDGDRENAGHTVPFRPCRREAINLVVGDRNCLPDPLPYGTGLAFEAFPKHRQGDIGGFSPGRLAANTIDYDEKATRLVAVESILVHASANPGIGSTRGNQRGESARARMQLSHGRSKWPTSSTPRASQMLQGARIEPRAPSSFQRTRSN